MRGSRSSFVIGRLRSYTGEIPIEHALLGVQVEYLLRTTYIGSCLHDTVLVNIVERIPKCEFCDQTVGDSIIAERVGAHQFVNNHVISCL